MKKKKAPKIKAKKGSKKKIKKYAIGGPITSTDYQGNTNPYGDGTDPADIVEGETNGNAASDPGDSSKSGVAAIGGAVSTAGDFVDTAAGKKTTGGSMLSAAGKGASVGAMLGGPAAPITAAIGAGIGALAAGIGAIVGKNKEKKAKRAQEKLASEQEYARRVATGAAGTFDEDYAFAGTGAMNPAKKKLPQMLVKGRGLAGMKDGGYINERTKKPAKVLVNRTGAGKKYKSGGSVDDIGNIKESKGQRTSKFFQGASDLLKTKGNNKLDEKVRNELKGVMAYNYGGLIQDPTDPYAKVLVNAKEKQNGYSDGGKIKGSGTGTSDSISAKLDKNDFVIPANAPKGLVDELMNHLGTNKKAALKSGGVPVKVSNNEHVVSKEDVPIAEAFLKPVGGLAALAPNAKGGSKLVEGGSPEEPFVIHPISGKVVPLSQAQKELETNKFMQIAFKENGGKFTLAKDFSGNLTKKQSQIIAESTKGDKARKLAELVKFTDEESTTESSNASIPTQNAANAKATGTETGTKSASRTSASVPSTLNSIDNILAQGNPFGPPLAQNVGPRATEAPETKLASNELPLDNERTSLVGVTSDQGPAISKKEFDANSQKVADSKNPFKGKDPARSLDADDKYVPDFDQKSTAMKIYETIGGAPGLLAAAQFGFGMKQLSKGFYPKDRLDPGLIAAQADAQKEAGYGLNANVISGIKSDIAGNLSGIKGATANAVAGNTGQYVGNIRAGMQDAGKAYANLAVADEETRLKKKGRSDALTEAIADYKRKLFEDERGKYIGDQTAAADLTQAGIHNFFNAMSADKVEKAADARAKKYGQTIIKVT